MEYNIEIKGDKQQINDIQYQTILKYAKLIEAETKLKVQVTNLFVVCEDGKYKSVSDGTKSVVLGSACKHCGDTGWINSNERCICVRE